MDGPKANQFYGRSFAKIKNKKKDGERGKVDVFFCFLYVFVYE